MEIMNKNILRMFIAFFMFFSLITPSFAAEIGVDIIEEPIIIGQYDAPLSESLDPDSPELMIVSNVRINSYATYDSNDGIQVYAKLYVPWYSFPKPQFTSMSGIVSTNLNNKTTKKFFYESANGATTIDTDVDTDVTGSRGDKGTISVSGSATANNALGGGGVFSISYPVTIP